MSVSKYTGMLKKSDLEGGVWVFVTESGERFHLTGLDEKLLKDGQKLELEGDFDSNSMGIGMMGPTLAVARAKAL
ncbi:MAG: hypothetical protein AMXMBFR33_22380 [Candidatus Xenobia bacterium]